MHFLSSSIFILLLTGSCLASLNIGSVIEPEETSSTHQKKDLPPLLCISEAQKWPLPSSLLASLDHLKTLDARPWASFNYHNKEDRALILPHFLHSTPNIPYLKITGLDKYGMGSLTLFLRPVNYLDLEGSKIGTQGFQALCKAVLYLSKLTALNLPYNNISRLGEEKFWKKLISQLTFLNLMGNPLEDQEFKSLTIEWRKKK